MSKHSQSSNDQRSNTKNPNNGAYTADRANRVAQGHADVPPPPSEVVIQPWPAPPAKQR